MQTPTPIFRLLHVAATLAMSGPATADDALEKPCAVLSRDETGKLQTVQLGTLRVLELTSEEASFVLPANAPKDVQAIRCGRTSIIPAVNDYKVLLAGYPLFISDEQDRVASLEMSGGHIRLRMLHGELTEDEQIAVGKRLDELQIAAQDTP